MNQKIISLMAGCLAMSLFSAGAIAQATKGPGSETLPPTAGCTAIPDDAYDGTVGTMGCVSISVPDAGFIDDVNVTTGLNHSWAGDLVIKVVAPGGTPAATVLSRPGFAEPADDGMGCCGDSSDMVSTSPFTFDDQGGGPTAEDMGSTILGTEFICQDDGICNYVSAPDAAAGTGLADFNGLTVAAGTWMVCVGDSAAGDVGEICSATLDITFLASDLSVVKTTTATDPVVIGDPIPFTLTASNAGPADAPDAVVTDTLPANLTYVSNDCGAAVAGQTITWTIGALANGASAVCNIATTVNAVGAIANTATITSSNSDPNAANNSSTAGLAGAMLADLSITAVSDAPANIGVGQQYTYTITGTNGGPNDATGLLFSMLLPTKISFVSSTCGAAAAGNIVSWSVPALASGASTSCDITVAVVAPGDIIITADVTSATPDPNLVNNSTQLVVGFQATQVPTLGHLGLLLIGLLLAGAGMVAIRRS